MSRSRGRALYDVARAETSKVYNVDALPLEWGELDGSTRMMWDEVTKLVEAQRRVIQSLLAEAD